MSALNCETLSQTKGWVMGRVTHAFVTLLVTETPPWVWSRTWSGGCVGSSLIAYPAARQDGPGDCPGRASRHSAKANQSWTFRRDCPSLARTVRARYGGRRQQGQVQCDGKSLRSVAVFLRRPASSGSILRRILCWPERTGIICDKLPCAESVGIKPNLFLVEPVILPE